MKKLFLPLFFLLSICISCGSDDDNTDTTPDGFDGSIESVENFFNSDIIEALDDLGFIINTGNTPPEIIDGTYVFSPFVLSNSSVPGDVVGYIFPDYIATFSNQNNEELTIDLQGVNGNQTDEGGGSFISGNSSKFSIYLKLTSTIGSVSAESAMAISGEIVPDGFGKIQVAFLMLDDNGDPEGVYISNNTGRLVYDSDEFSPLQ